VNEKTLIRGCQKGEKDAFEELIRMYYPYVSGFLLKMSRDKFLSEDLTQDTFLKMIRSIEKYDCSGTAAFGTWIITIAKNCYIDHLRRNRISFEDIDGLQLDGKTDPADQAAAEIQFAEVRSEVRNLPPEQGIAIRLKYEEDLTLEEIAKRFGVPSKTIKSRIHDGTVKLRKRLRLKGRSGE
jgi:RNA polymerase sigma-70 factor (ECF subfamily)